MRRKQFTEEQSAFALRQAESGTPVAEVIRKMGITEPTCLTLEEAVCRHGRDGDPPPQAARG